MRQQWLDENPWYHNLPLFSSGMVIRCPTKNRDDTPIRPEDVPGCGSQSVTLSEDGVYDCLDCGIFFSDFAADPPHRRTSLPEDSGSRTRLAEFQCPKP